MFDGCVLGVDPGVASLGLAVLRREGSRTLVVWTRNLKTPSSLAEPQRLRRIYQGIGEAIAVHAPYVVAIERLMWGRNVGSAMKVSRASGVILLAAADAGLPVEEYAPLEVKMAVTGVGNAGKEQVRLALARTHGLQGVPDQPDAADAVAVAFCHMQQSKLRTLAKEAAAR